MCVFAAEFGITWKCHTTLESPLFLDRKTNSHFGDATFEVLQSRPSIRLLALIMSEVLCLVGSAGWTLAQGTNMAVNIYSWQMTLIVPLATVIVAKRSYTRKEKTSLSFSKILF